MTGKLLFFASDYQIGLSALLTDQAIALHTGNVPLICVCGEKEQEQRLRARLQDKGVPFQVIQGLDAHSSVLHLARSISSVILHDEISVVHVQNNWQLALIFLVRIRLLFKKKLSIVYTLHGFRHNSLIKSIMARAAIGAALLVSTSRIICMCQYLATVFFPLKWKISIIPLGIPEIFFERRNLPDIQVEGLQIIYPAQFRKGKNQNIVIKAFADYLKQSGDTKSRLCLPGSGDLLEEMKELTKSLNISERVHFPGQCTKNQIFSLYQQHNIAVVASNRETFGQSIVEPFCMGRLVISRNVGIAPDIITHEKNGFLFDSAEDLTRIFLQLQDCSSLITFTEETKKKAQLFTWENIVPRLKKIYFPSHESTK